MFRLRYSFLVWSICILFFNQNLHSMILEKEFSSKYKDEEFYKVYSKYEPLDYEDKTVFYDKVVGGNKSNLKMVHSYNSYNLHQNDNRASIIDSIEMIYGNRFLIKSFLEYKKLLSNSINGRRSNRLVFSDSREEFFPKPPSYPYTIVQWDSWYMKNFLLLNSIDKIDKLYSLSVSWCKYKKNRLLPVLRVFVDNSGDYSYGGGIKLAVGSWSFEMYQSNQTMFGLWTYEQGITLNEYVGDYWNFSFNLNRSTPVDFYGNFDYSYTPTITYMYMKDTLMFSPYISLTMSKKYMSEKVEKYYSLGLYAGI